MAYKPSKRLKKIYNRYIRNMRNVRTVMRYGRQLGERSLVGLDEANLRELPELTIPREIRNQTVFKDEEDFKKKFESLRDFRNLDYYYKKNYKDKILNLWADKISDVAVQIYGKEVKPETNAHYYSKEQLEQFKELDDYMKLYNSMNYLNISKFMEAYFKGYIKPFKYIYNELSVYGSVEGRGVETSGVEEAREMMSLFFKTR